MQRVVCLLLVVAACGSETTPPRHAEPRLRRLLAHQYTSSIAALLGPRAAAVAAPPADIANAGFESIGAAELSPSDMALGQYEASANAVVNAALGDVAALPARIGCTPTGEADTACFQTFARTFGRRAFRRPLTEDEVMRYSQLAQTAAGRYHDAYAGIGYAISAFLQSPNFVYQVEIGEVDEAEPSRRRLTSYEMATRLAYFLTSTMPDDALLDVAEQGQLVTPEQVRAVAMDLVSRAEAREALDGFYEERMKLRELAGLQKDQAAFPLYTPALAESMRRESLLLLRDIVWDRDVDYRELYTAPYAFVDSSLARLYGTAAVTSGTFEKRMLPAPRQGVFGEAAFLSIEAHPASTSPTRRGRFVEERVLCTEIPPPPPDVNTQLPMPPPDMPRTMRERLATHTASERCAACHARMDGIGLALENFDAIGAFRTTDQGLPIDASGVIADVAAFDGLPGLGQVVREQPELHRCWVRSLYRHATGHVEAEGDEVALADVETTFTESYKVKSLLVEIVVSDAFRFVDNKENN
jgi:hypothetical protein